MAITRPSILTLQIDKIVSGLYRAEVLQNGAQVTPPNTHSSISEAIKEEALAVPDGFAHFMEVRYYGLSSGTIALLQLPQQAETVAERLVELRKELHHIDEDR